MNWQHLSTLLWVRTKLQLNSYRRHGMWNFVIIAIAAGFALASSLIGFFAALVAGSTLLASQSGDVWMLVCDVWTLGFLFMWMMGVVMELQRGDLLSFDKLLHLPTSLTEVYVFNFLGSLISLTTLTFVPPMVGLCLAMLIAKGPAALVAVLLLGGFLLMVCAVTYQFRGWIATVMLNKRHQQTVMVLAILFIVLGAQAPNLIHLAVRQQWQQRAQNLNSRTATLENELQQQLTTKKISAESYSQRLHELHQLRTAEQAALWEASQGRFFEVLRLVNLALPLGWLAFGVGAAVDGDAWSGLLGSLAMSLVAIWSLRQSYFSTVRFYTGAVDLRESVVTVGSPGTAVPGLLCDSDNAAPAVWKGSMVEWSIPGMSESVAAIAWSSFRGLSRAAETKLIMLGPLFVLVIFGGMLFTTLGRNGIPDAGRPMLLVAALGMSVIGISSVSQNQFGSDRGGFRAYVLSGVSRRDVLLGKNLALVPLVVLLTLPTIVVVQCLVPSNVALFAVVVIEIPTIFLAVCLLGNYCSLLAPFGKAANSMQAANFKFVPMLLQMVFSLATMLVVFFAAVVPIGLEVLLQQLGVLSPWIPLALALATLELVVGLAIYRILIGEQGALLSARECRILEAVTEKGE